MSSQGPLSPGTVVNDTSVGTEAWGIYTGPIDNIKLIDGNYVDCSVTGEDEEGDHSNYLKVTNFGFSIPNGATIDGIEVLIRNGPPGYIGANTYDWKVQMIKSDSSISSTNRADSRDFISYPSQDIVYGSSTDLWGETWTPSDINNSNFGFALAVMGGSGGGYAYLDAIRITVYYTETTSNSAITGLSTITGIQSITF